MKRSLLDIIREKLKKKPATEEQLIQLRLEKEKAELERDIAIAKYKKKNPGGSHDKKSSKQKRVSESFGKGSSPDGGLSKMIGKNDSSKYKGLTS